MTPAAYKYALLGLVPVALMLAACEDKHTSRVDELMSAAQKDTSDVPPPPPPAKEWKEMPSITVDNLGAYIGGERANLSEKEGPAKLKNIVSRLPIEGKAVTIAAQKKAKTKDVAAVVWELGAAGAPSVIIKTDGRGDLPSEITVVPEQKISKPKGCSVAVMVNDKLDTGVWNFKGGLGRKHPKGFAGPDLSNTERSVQKELDICDSSLAFFSGSYKHDWQHAYNLGALLTKVSKDNDGKIDKVVLLADEPVAGRPIVLRSQKK